MSRKKVLIVDDSATFVMLEKTLFMGWNLEVVTANDGLAAIKAAKTHKPDLIFMDVQMPNMTGVEATRMMRNDPETAEIPIFLVTTLSSASDREKGVEAGATEYLTKPITREIMEGILRKYIKDS